MRAAKILAVGLAALVAAASWALDHPLGDLDGDYDLRASDLPALVTTVRHYRAGQDWNRQADTDNDGQLTHTDFAVLLDQLIRALSTNPWQLLTAAEQDILNERWSAARSKLEWLVQVRGSWPRTHGWLAVVYHALSGPDNNFMDLAVAKYRDFARAWRLAKLGHIDEREARFEGTMMALMNSERRQRGIFLLLPHPDLGAAAYYHSVWMYDTQTLDHREDNPETDTPLRRVVRQAGCMPSKLSENVGRASDASGVTLDTVSYLHGLFMNSENHRANILRTTVRYFAVGLRATDTQLWCTHNFIMLDEPAGACPGHRPR